MYLPQTSLIVLPLIYKESSLPSRAPQQVHRCAWFLLVMLPNLYHGLHIGLPAPSRSPDTTPAIESRPTYSPFLLNQQLLVQNVMNSGIAGVCTRWGVAIGRRRPSTPDHRPARVSGLCKRSPHHLYGLCYSPGVAELSPPSRALHPCTQPKVAGGQEEEHQEVTLLL